MEKQLDDLSIFEEYRDRQVIINYYQEDDFLSKRDGFHFVSIQFAYGQLLFLKRMEILLRFPYRNFRQRSLTVIFKIIMFVGMAMFA
ncbi:hypothetical protein [Neobacillus sp. 19]|uniref:hypothetical protein n=1 Tax=Neobacillus sp. 19 TaxID=3394458 RepID=UPI003BF6D1CB